MSQSQPFVLLAGLSISALVAESSWVIAQEPTAPAIEPTTDPFAEDERFLLSEPETAEEFFRAALQAQRLARPNLARQYLQRFSDLNPTDDQLLALRDDFGPAAFSRLANQPELQPLSTEIAERVTQVFRERGASPERVEALINALGGLPAEAFTAREALINAGEAVIPQVISALRSPSNENARRQLLDVLVGMGAEALPALHAGLNAPDDDLRLQLIAVIGRIGDRQSIPYLYLPAFGPSQSAAIRSEARDSLAEVARLSRTSADAVQPADASLQLQEAAKNILRTPTVSVQSAQEHATDQDFWLWDPAAQTVRKATVSQAEANLLNATRLARESFLLAPDREETQAFYLATLMETEAVQAGSHQPPAGPGTAFSIVLASGARMGVPVLRESLSLSLNRAAIGALGVISQTSSSSILFGGDSILLDSLNSSSARVQLASAIAFLRLDPRTPFPESGRVVEILSRNLTDEVQSAAVIIDPNSQRAANIAGFVRQMGFSAVSATTGQEGFSLAAEQLNPALILVNLNVSRWPLSQTLANFKADSRTREVPIIVVGPPAGEWQAATIESEGYRYFRVRDSHDPRPAVRRALSDVEGVAYVVETTTAAAFAAQVRPVLTSFTTEPMNETERQTAKGLAAYWLAQIADTGRTDVFPLARAESALISALWQPELTGNALIGLGAIPTASAQRAIANLLLTPNIADEVKIAAAEELLDHIAQFGLTLGGDSIRRIAQLEESTTNPQLLNILTAIRGAVGSSNADLQQQLRSYPATPLELLAE